MVIRGQSIKKKKMDRTTDQFGNGKVMELKQIKHDEALKDLAGQLKKLFGAWAIEQPAYTTP